MNDYTQGQKKIAEKIIKVIANTDTNNKTKIKNINALFEMGTIEDIAKALTLADITFHKNEYSSIEEYFAKYDFLHKVLNREYKIKADILEFYKLLGKLPWATKHVESFLKNAINNAITKKIDKTPSRIIPYLRAFYGEDFKNFSPKLLALYIQLSASQYQNSLGFELFVPEIIEYLIKNDKNGESIYSKSSSNIKTEIYSACMQIFAFDVNKLTDMQKESAKNILTFLLSHPQAEIYCPPFFVAIDDKNTKSVLSLLTERQRLEIINKFSACFLEKNKNDIFSNVYKLHEENKSNFYDCLAGIITYNLDCNISPDAITIPTIVFEHHCVKISNISILENSNKESIFLPNIENLNANFKNALIREVVQKVKGINESFAIIDYVDVSKEEQKYDIAKFFFFSKNIKRLPANDKTMEDYSYFYDKENELYSVSFSTSKMPKFELRLNNNFFSKIFKKDLELPGIKKINKYFNIVDSTFAEKIVNFPEVDKKSKNLENKNKKTFNIVGKYKEDLEKINYSLRNDGNDKNIIFIENLEKLTDNMGNISNLYKDYLNKGSNLSKKLEKVLNDFVPLIEDAIRQYNIYTLTQTSGTYKKEIENGIDAISKQINALIDNLNVEITNIINQENVFSIIDLQAKLSVSNQMINYDSIDDIIENGKIVYEDENFRIKKENGVYKPQISYLNNWIDISKKDLKEIDPKNYEKFNEITKSNIDLNFGKEI